MANNVVFYWIKAKDVTSAAMKSAKANLENFKQTAKQTHKGVADEAEKAGKQTVVATKEAGDALDDTGAKASDLGMVFNLMHGNIEGCIRDLAKLAEGNETAAAAVKKLNINTVSLGLTGATIGYLTYLWNVCAEAIEGAKKKLLDFMSQSFDRSMTQLTQAAEKFNSTIDRQNSELDRNLGLLKSLDSAKTSLHQAELEAARERELNELSVDDVAGRQAVNDKYDYKSRALASASRDKQYDEEYDALQQKLWNEEDRKSQLEITINRLRKQKKDLYDQTQYTSGEEGEELERQLTQTRSDLAKYEDQLDSCIANIDTMRQTQNTLTVEREAAIASEAAAEAKRIRERADAEEEAQKKAEEEARKAAEEQAAYEARLAEEQAREEERLAQQLLREKLEAEKQLHAQKVSDAKNELAESQQAQSSAQGRLAAAQAQVQQAWGWYKDKDSMQREIDNYTAQKAAEQQFEKDFERLKRKYGSNGWRDIEMGKLSVEDEATRQVALAKENEEQAAKALDEIAENTRELAEKLDELLTAKEE